MRAWSFLPSILLKVGWISGQNHGFQPSGPMSSEVKKLGPGFFTSERSFCSEQRTSPIHFGNITYRTERKLRLGFFFRCGRGALTCGRRTSGIWGRTVLAGNKHRHHAENRQRKSEDTQDRLHLFSPLCYTEIQKYRHSTALSYRKKDKKSREPLIFQKHLFSSAVLFRGSAFFRYPEKGCAPVRKAHSPYICGFARSLLEFYCSSTLRTDLSALCRFGSCKVNMPSSREPVIRSASTWETSKLLEKEP